MTYLSIAPFLIDSVKYTSKKRKQRLNKKGLRTQASGWEEICPWKVSCVLYKLQYKMECPYKSCRTDWSDIPGHWLTNPPLNIVHHDETKSSNFKLNCWNISIKMLALPLSIVVKGEGAVRIIWTLKSPQFLFLVAQYCLVGKFRDLLLFLKSVTSNCDQQQQRQQQQQQQQNVSMIFLSSLPKQCYFEGGWKWNLQGRL